MNWDVMMGGISIAAGLVSSTWLLDFNRRRAQKRARQEFLGALRAEIQSAREALLSISEVIERDDVVPANMFSIQLHRQLFLGPDLTLVHSSTRDLMFLPPEEIMAVLRLSRTLRLWRGQVEAVLQEPVVDGPKLSFGILKEIFDKLWDGLTIVDHALLVILVKDRAKPGLEGLAVAPPSMLREMATLDETDA